MGSSSIPRRHGSPLFPWMFPMLKTWLLCKGVPVVWDQWHCLMLTKACVFDTSTYFFPFCHLDILPNDSPLNILRKVSLKFFLIYNKMSLLFQLTKMERSYNDEKVSYVQPEVKEYHPDHHRQVLIGIMIGQSHNWSSKWIMQMSTRCFIFHFFQKKITCCL